MHGFHGGNGVGAFLGLLLVLGFAALIVSLCRSSGSK
jgi:glycerol-3-phosphate acyltransferase PlsY